MSHESRDSVTSYFITTLLGTSILTYMIYKPPACSSEPLPLIAMATRDVFTLDDVMNELDVDDLFKDESEDDFHGYLDADSDGERNESDERNERYGRCEG